MKKDILIIFDVAFPFYKGGAQRRFFEVGRRFGSSKKLNKFTNFNPDTDLESGIKKINESLT